ncbi:MAG TPA: hypothetical protein VIA62_11770 [Thermoanaerobaculia bacterium]|jgi:hypothetical protein|nr:hypothetical protein [Thermoanaerobaculia bacterium]
MKRVLVLVAVLLLIGSLAAWAEGTAAGPAPGGGCVLPDLGQLSPDQVAVAALRAGLQISASTPVSTVQACPTTFQCSSIAGCGSSMVCSANPIGNCCSEGNVVLCCSHTIFVVSCPCKCVLEDCPRQCGQSTQVNWSCS